MKLLVSLSSLLALVSATSNTRCEDCHAVVSTLSTYLTSTESLANQVDILLAEVCPGADDPEECVDGLPGFWQGIAMILWPGYWDPEAEWMCNTEDICPSQIRDMTCQDCFDGIKAGIEQLLLPSTITGIIEALSGDVFCGTFDNSEECASIIEALIPVALPALAGSGGSEENLTAICNMAVPDTCPAL